MNAHPRYTKRTVEWGNWGITFMDQQPDASKNFGVIVGHVWFGVGACGPVDGCFGSPTREAYKAACAAWVESRQLPEGFVPAKVNS